MKILVSEGSSPTKSTIQIHLTSLAGPKYVICMNQTKMVNTGMKASLLIF